MKKFMLFLTIAASLALVSCTSGVGRAASLAVSGIPPTVPMGVDSIEVEYLRLAKQEIEDIKAGNVQDADGKVVPDALLRQAMMLEDRQARIVETQKLFAELRTWMGIEKGAAPGATQEEAAKNRAAMIQAILDRMNKIQVDTKAKKFDALVKPAEKPAE